VSGGWDGVCPAEAFVSGTTLNAQHPVRDAERFRGSVEAAVIEHLA